MNNPGNFNNGNGNSIKDSFQAAVIRSSILGFPGDHKRRKEKRIFLQSQEDEEAYLAHKTEESLFSQQYKEWHALKRDISNAVQQILNPIFEKTNELYTRRQEIFQSLILLQEDYDQIAVIGNMSYLTVFRSKNALGLENSNEIETMIKKLRDELRVLNIEISQNTALILKHTPEFITRTTRQLPKNIASRNH